MRMAGKVGIVTGGSLGMGRAGAMRFAREGAAVVVVARPTFRAVCARTKYEHRDELSKLDFDLREFLIFDVSAASRFPESLKSPSAIRFTVPKPVTLAHLARS